MTFKLSNGVAVRYVADASRAPGPARRGAVTRFAVGDVVA